MAATFSREPMLEVFIFECAQLIENLESEILESEKSNKFCEKSVNEIFRIMHTIKGSSAMMMYNEISSLAHSIEDVFYFIREVKTVKIDFTELCDLIFKAIDFIKSELSKIEEGIESNTSSKELIDELKLYLTNLKESNVEYSDISKPASQNKTRYYVSPSTTIDDLGKINYSVKIYFEEDCSMENIRAFNVIHNLKEFADVIEYHPSNILDSDETAELIKSDGFTIIFTTKLNNTEMEQYFEKVVFLKSFELNEVKEKAKYDINELSKNVDKLKVKNKAVTEEDLSSINTKQSFISVNIKKLDILMDLVGELVISEAMVTRNPEIEKFQIESFQKASRHHRKIITELQDMVMSVRMVPLAATFQKMNRIVRDMTKKLKKDIELEIIGEDTEVDKNIIEHISDPLMHLIRNSIDHGIESEDERIKKGKQAVGKIILEARNAGGDVIISVKDDGKGLNKDKIYEKAFSNGLTSKLQHELTNKEIYSYVFMPGFSTKESVTEFSGRGVGMDVVSKNIEEIGGNIEIESVDDEGSIFSIKIPLTLAIINGMIVTVGKYTYIIPTISIKESFKMSNKEVITDPNGNEMIMVRGQGYNIYRLHDEFKVENAIHNIEDGIVLMVEDENQMVGIFVDSLIGEQQVVVKALPKYFKRIRGIAGCTLLGDGSISLIIDVGLLINSKKI